MVDSRQQGNGDAIVTKLTAAFVALLACASAAFGQSVASKDTVATDGYTAHAIHQFQGGPAVSGTARYFSYMDNTADTHNTFVYKYTTAAGWVKSSSIGANNPSCCDGHDSPTIFRDSNGYLDVFYAGVTAGQTSGSGCSSRNQGPFYRRSTNPDDITAWGAESRVPICGSLSEVNGGYGTSNTLHMIGELQWEAAYHSYDLMYARRNSGLSWATSSLVHDDGLDDAYNPPYTVGPGCMMNLFVSGDNLHMVWSSTTDGCAGSGSKLYYATSADSGDNWASANGSSTFTRAAGLGATAALTYPADYLVSSGVTTNDMKVAVFNGKPVIAMRVSSTIKLYTYASGTTWNATTVEATTSAAPYGLAMGVVGGQLAIVSGNGADVILYTSTDGSTWTESTIHTQGSETSNRNFQATVYGSSLYVTWVQTTAGAEKLMAAEILFESGSRTFDGVNDVITFTDIDDLDSLTKWTVAFSVKPGSVTTMWQHIINKQDDANENGWDIGIGPSADPNEIYVLAANGGNAWARTTGADLAAGTWYDVAVVYDGTQGTANDRIKVYIGAVQSASTTGAGTLPASLPAVTEALLFGSPRGTGDAFFNGDLANVRIWSGVAKTAGELSDVLTDCTPIENLELYCPLSGLDNPGIDLSGNTRHGTITGAVAGSEPDTTTGLSLCPIVTKGGLHIF